MLSSLIDGSIPASSSPLGSSPMLYRIKSDNRDILFIESGMLTSVVHYYIITQDKEPADKWIQLKRLTGEYDFVDKIGDDTKSLYVPILELEKSTFDFPL